MNTLKKRNEEDIFSILKMLDEHQSWQGLLAPMTKFFFTHFCKEHSLPFWISDTKIFSCSLALSLLIVQCRLQRYVLPPSVFIRSFILIFFMIPSYFFLSSDFSLFSLLPLDLKHILKLTLPKYFWQESVWRTPYSRCRPFLLFFF
jgi:hypothetical protein